MTSSSPDLVTNPTIQTFVGELFDIFDPNLNQINLKDISHALSMICRYGGHSREFYSVAEHSVLIAGYFEKTGHTDLARWGLMHDATEAYMGDLIRPLKRALPAYAAAEDNLMAYICTKFDLPIEQPGPIKEADLRITTDEREILMFPRVWSYDPLEPLGVELQCWTHDQAEQAWLDTYWRLFA